MRQEKVVLPASTDLLPTDADTGPRGELLPSRPGTGTGRDVVLWFDRFGGSDRGITGDVFARGFGSDGDRLGRFVLLRRNRLDRSGRKLFRTDGKLCVAGRKLFRTHGKLRVTDRKLLVTGRKLLVAGWRFRVDGRFDNRSFAR